MKEVYPGHSLMQVWRYIGMGSDIQKRKSGIALVGDLPWGTHFCQFYKTRKDLFDMLVPYFKAGLESNEKCILVTSDFLN